VLYRVLVFPSHDNHEARNDLHCWQTTADDRVRLDREALHGERQGQVQGGSLKLRLHDGQIPRSECRLRGKVSLLTMRPRESLTIKSTKTKDFAETSRVGHNLGANAETAPKQ